MKSSVWVARSCLTASRVTRLTSQELLEHPHISTAAVCGIADAEYGQAVAAAVVIKPDAPAGLAPADIIAFAKTKLASYSVPRRVVFIQELPVNAMGKVSSGGAGSSCCSLHIKIHFILEYNIASR